MAYIKIYHVHDIYDRSSKVEQHNMQSRQDLVSAEGWRWFEGALKQVLVIAKGVLIDKHGVDKTWSTHTKRTTLNVYHIVCSASSCLA